MTVDLILTSDSMLLFFFFKMEHKLKLTVSQVTTDLYRHTLLPSLEVEKRSYLASPLGHFA